MIWQVRKRDGRTMPFNMDKITSAIEKALRASGELSEEIQAEASQLDLLNVGSNTIQRRAMEVASGVVGRLESLGLESPDIEQIQDAAEYVLGEMGLQETAKAFILYRAERSRVRELNTRLMRTLHDITFSDAAKSDLKRENANIDGDTAMGIMLKYGSESAKHFYTSIMLKPEHSRAHQEGDIIFMIWISTL